MSETNLDVKDRKLLYQLDINARQNYSKLAKKVGISKQLTKYRVERLEKSGLIKGYYALIDTSKLGYISYRIYIKFRNINQKAKEEMIDYVQNQKAIFAVALISGKWDLDFLFNVKEVYDFYKHWDDIMENYLEYIMDYKVCIYSPVYHFSKAYLINVQDEAKIRILGGRAKLDIDETDKKLLMELSKNARITLVELSQKLKLSPEALSHRIKQLEKNEVIQGYRALIDISKLGKKFYKVDFRLRSLKNFKQILSYCHLNPNIYQLNRTIGGETLEIEFHVSGVEHLHEELEKMETAFPNTIEYYDYYIIFKELKVVYMPEDTSTDSPPSN